MTPVVVKVQIPIVSSDPKAKPMVYDKDLRHVAFQTLDDATITSLGGAVKGYFKATWSEEQSQWLIESRVKDAMW